MKVGAQILDNGRNVRPYSPPSLLELLSWYDSCSLARPNCLLRYSYYERIAYHSLSLHQWGRTPYRYYYRLRYM